MTEIIQYPFMQRALIAGIVLGALLSIIGVFVILRKMAFFSDGIAHASLAGIAAGILFSFNPLVVAIISSAFFAIIMFFLEKKYQLSSDASIGIIFTSGMALGVVLLSFSPGYQPELISFLFGNILAINQSELALITALSLIILLLIKYNYKSLVLFALDEESAYLSGVKTTSLQLAGYVALAVSVVLGIKVLGIILVSALIIIPAATAKAFSKSFKRLIWVSLAIAEASILAGIIASYYLDLPTGPTIVLTGTLFFAISTAYNSIKNKR